MPASSVTVVKNDWAKATERIHEAIAAEVQAVTQDLLEKSIPLAPLEHGDLRRSAGMTMEGTKGTVFFDAVYAAMQHERTDLYHDDGQAKYLETPLEQNRKVYTQRIADAMKRELNA